MTRVLGTTLMKTSAGSSENREQWHRGATSSCASAHIRMTVWHLAIMSRTTAVILLVLGVVFAADEGARVCSSLKSQ